jgi:hypothetical protein
VRAALAFAFVSACAFEIHDVVPDPTGATASVGGGGTGGTAQGGCGGDGCQFPQICWLTDDFDDGRVETFWNAFAGAACSATETGGALLVQPAPNQPDAVYCGYVTEDEYDMRCGEISVRVEPLTATGAETLLSLTAGPEVIKLNVIDGYLHVATKDVMNVHQTPYQETQHRYWRVRERMGTLTFETSGDGMGWMMFYEMPVPATAEMDKVVVTLSAGTFQNQVPTPGEARFDCFNVPSCP